MSTKQPDSGRIESRRQHELTLPMPLRAGWQNWDFSRSEAVIRAHADGILLDTVASNRFYNAWTGSATGRMVFR